MAAPAAATTSAGTQLLHDQNPFNFAMLVTRDPGLFKREQLFLGNPLPPEMKRAHGPYSISMFARTGVNSPTRDSIAGTDATGNRPFGLYYWAKAGAGASPWEAEPKALTDTQVKSPLAGVVDYHFCLRLWPVPDGLETNLSGEDEQARGVLTTRPHMTPRLGPSNEITISDWTVDTVLSMPPVANPKRREAQDWLEAYISMFESLATPLPALGRKPYLALKFGDRWWGLGRNAVVLQSVQVQRKYYERGRLASATMSLRFAEVAMV